MTCVEISPLKQRQHETETKVKLPILDNRNPRR